MKPICERVNGTLRRDPLDRVLIIGERHLALVLREYAAHYNGRRPHPSPGDGGPRIGRRSQSGTWQTCGPCVETCRRRNDQRILPRRVTRAQTNVTQYPSGTPSTFMLSVRVLSSTCRRQMRNPLLVTGQDACRCRDLLPLTPVIPPALLACRPRLSGSHCLGE